MHYRLRQLVYAILLLFFASSCVSVKTAAIKRDIKKIVRKSDVFSKYFVGFALYDPADEQYISEINADLYFTPASNTKILTLGAYLSTDRDSIPSFLIGRDGENTYLRPLGDPTFLHPDFDNQASYSKLYDLTEDTLLIDFSYVDIESFGPGWAWDDYVYSYQPERSLLPIYGNIVRAEVNHHDYSFRPPFFSNYIDLNGTANYREKDYNLFNFSLDKYLGDTSVVDIPFTVDEELVGTLFSDTLYKTIVIVENTPSLNWDTIYNNHSLPVLALMMQRSDNFLAEQLLINSQLSEGFNTLQELKVSIDNTIFRNVEDPLIWVDGSGLSRYNMVTPKSLIQVLDAIYNKVSWSDLTMIFPTGGVSGTIKNWYSGEEPYVFAKTGTLRHNHCLSGYLVTNSGRTLIFSFMNNHFTMRNAEVKSEMQRLLEAVRDNY